MYARVVRFTDVDSDHLASRVAEAEARAEAIRGVRDELTGRLLSITHRIEELPFPTLAAINESLLTTLGACGDVERNVMAPPAPYATPVYQELQRVARGGRAHDVAVAARARSTSWTPSAPTFASTAVAAK